MSGVEFPRSGFSLQYSKGKSLRFSLGNEALLACATALFLVLLTVKEQVGVANLCSLRQADVSKVR